MPFVRRTRATLQGRVRLLRRLRVNARAHATLLRRALQRGTGRLVLDCLAAFANKLIYRRHVFFPRLTGGANEQRFRVLTFKSGAKRKRALPASFRNWWLAATPGCLGGSRLSGSQRRRAALLNYCCQGCSVGQFRQVWMMASLEPTFLWRRIFRREGRSLSRVPTLEPTANAGRRRQLTPQYLSKPNATGQPGQRLHTDRTNPSVALFTSDCRSETRDYKG